MNLKHLIDEFELLTDTEEGLNKFKKYILDLAIQGQLTKQDLDTEPAEKLVERIKEKKERLYEQGKVRKPKDLEPIEDDDKPFELPSNWVWSRMDDVTEVVRGITFPASEKNQEYEEGLICCLKTSNVQEEVVWDDVIFVDEKYVKSEEKLLREGDILISMANSYELVGKVALIRNLKKRSSLGGFISAIRTLGIDNKYLFYLLRSEHIQSTFRESSSQTTNIANLSLKRILPILFPIPPLEEQQRIVQKIEILFSQVDELEQKVQQDRQVDERLQVAVLDDLQRAETPEASRQSWQRLTDHFDQIYRKPEHIDQLKQAILNEAVRGRLVPQDPSDEPAEKLLECIIEEKQRLYDEGEIRKPSDLPEVSEEEKPYELPKGWIWERLGNLGVINPRNDADDDIEASFVPMKMISENFSYKHEFEVKKWKEIKSGYTHFAEGDIGLAKITPCFENGKAAIFQNLKNGIGAGTTELYIFRPINNTILNRFAYLYLQTPKFRVEGKNNMTGTAGQQRVPKSYFEEALFPLPPFNEQKRIIEKIYELFRWCDDLKEKLSRAKQTDQRLLEALVNGKDD